MEKNCAELKQLSDKTQEVHRNIKASNKLSAVLENVQASAQELDTSVWNGKIKLAAVNQWNSLVTMFDSHIKSSEAI